MIKPNDYFTKIFCINLARRRDRWEHVEHQCRLHGLNVERFEAYDAVVMDGTAYGTAGCCASHRALLELTAYHRWPRVLVLEDDFEICVSDFQDRFSRTVLELPDDWDMFYLGGSYGEAPQYRHSPHLIRANRLMTTSSYAVTAAMARRLAPHASGSGPIDSIYGRFHADAMCFVAQPRLMVQYANVSDLEGRYSDNRGSMLDPHHEDMLLEGDWVLTVNGYMRLRSHLLRPVLASPGDMNGHDVIVGRERFRIVRIEHLPAHPPPWTRGESCTYVLETVTP